MLKFSEFLNEELSDQNSLKLCLAVIENDYSWYFVLFKQTPELMEFVKKYRSVYFNGFSDLILATCSIEKEGECDDNFKRMSTYAGKSGYGVLMFAIVLYHFDIMPSDDVSKEASAIWDAFYKRPNIEKIEIQPQPGREHGCAHFQQRFHWHRERAQEEEAKPPEERYGDNWNYIKSFPKDVLLGFRLKNKEGMASKVSELKQNYQEILDVYLANPGQWETPKKEYLDKQIYELGRDWFRNKHINRKK